MSALATFRKKLHAQPELSGEEENTAKIITKALQEYHPTQIIQKIGGHGVAAIFDSKKPGETTLFRSELDALPIQEINNFGHTSKKQGVSHKCGHDGHATILVGLAEKISQNPPKKGKVILLFQPAEETGEGAQAVLKDPKFSDLHPDQIYALHNVPGFKIGEIICKPDTFTASVSSVAIQLSGKTAHAAEPENGINPDLAIAELILRLKKRNHTNPNAANFAVITTIYTQIGSQDYGISAGDGAIHFTIRCWEAKKLDTLKKEVETVVSEICEKHKLKHKLKWFYEFVANKNDKAHFATIKKAAEKNNFAFHLKEHPFKWGEDFGVFTQKYKGAMFGLGAGENTPALHNPDYDFPDELISIGINMFHSILESDHA